MADFEKEIFFGQTPLKHTTDAVLGDYVNLLGEEFYKIENSAALEPFFMTLVSSSDHWLFISSNGGLTAGRVNSDRALFPYYTEDKITDNHSHTGHKAVFLVSRGGRTSLWEPFSDRGQGLYSVARNLYKNISGTTLIFEECNFDLGLVYCYAWRTSDRFGFVKTSWLVNQQDSPCQIELLDGLQNILPANISEQAQNAFSCLLDAYKRSEVDPQTGLAIYALNSRMTDKAEPSESLMATTVCQVGLLQADYLLTPEQLEHFRLGEQIKPEVEVRGQRGAYFAHARLNLAASQEFTWHLLADVYQDSADIAQLDRWLLGDPPQLMVELEKDIASGQSSLWKMVASADGVQLTEDRLAASNHFANVMFNIMRGGIFADQYWVNSHEFIEFISTRSRQVLTEYSGFFSSLPARIHLSELLAKSQASGSPDLVRLSLSFLPLIFSRRHGDPSRPWNHFSINLKKSDGTMKLDFEGNWRDIFQNWEALAWSYPEYVESMLSTFLNATTADGYNPYRITLHGIEWEVPDPGNPWSNIGYWSDHQVIYLLKLMEISTRLHPGKLEHFLAQPVFSYSNVPYRLKPYQAIMQDPHNTIDFDWQVHRDIEARVAIQGTDARLVIDPAGKVVYACLAEKLLTLVLAKLSNFVPEGGIWMNTQRPEWNDANNALVGKGLSVVTLCYLRRMLAFLQEFLKDSQIQAVPLHEEVFISFRQSQEILLKHKNLLDGSFTGEQRRSMMDALGECGHEYRVNLYTQGFSGKIVDLPLSELISFFVLFQQYVEHTLRLNRRHDGMYHAYNILHVADGCASVDHLYEMLEGQVAILSSNLLSAAESLEVLTALRRSALYQANQHSYILYPDRVLPGFMHKNNLSKEQIKDLALFNRLIEDQERSLITSDINGNIHFSSPIRNISDVRLALSALQGQPRYEKLVEAEFGEIKSLFEATFHHNEFTGRSGTFFAYEGLGSIYWHMVSKLLLAVQETILRSKNDPVEAELVQIYRDIRRGMGYKKTPAEYGAFPTDPYSHTPKGRGAKQPGMTGMVKEAILTRQAELGATFDQGRLIFDSVLFDPQELLTSPASFSYLDVHGQPQQIDLDSGTLAYTVCQAAVIVHSSSKASITVYYSDGTSQFFNGKILDEENSQHIFLRDGKIRYLSVSLPLQ